MRGCSCAFRVAQVKAAPSKATNNRFNMIFPRNEFIAAKQIGCKENSGFSSLVILLALPQVFARVQGSRRLVIATRAVHEMASQGVYPASVHVPHDMLRHQS